LRAYVARVERLYPGPSEVRLPPYRYRPWPRRRAGLALGARPI